MQRGWLAVFLFAAFIGCTTVPKELPLSLRFHVQTTEEVGKKNIWPVQLTNPHSTIFIPTQAALNEEDIQSLEMLPGGRTLVTFTEVGKVKLETVTRSSVGLILVVVYKDRVVYAPIIDMALHNGRFIIPQGLSEEELESLRKVIRGEYEVEMEEKFILEDIF